MTLTFDLWLTSGWRQCPQTCQPCQLYNSQPLTSMPNTQMS